MRMESKKKIALRCSFTLLIEKPTLHKPGIMAHSVRVLHNPTQKTIRMHYASKSSYFVIIVIFIAPE